MRVAGSELPIRSVDALVVGAGMRNWIFVKVVAGDFVGWGEATLEFSTSTVVGAIDDLRPLVVGSDAMATTQLFHRLTRHHFWRLGIEGMSAVSGIDQALHDVKAQALGVPIHQLLGGPVRDRIRLYDHLGGARPTMCTEPSIRGASPSSPRRASPAGSTPSRCSPCRLAARWRRGRVCGRRRW